MKHSTTSNKKSRSAQREAVQHIKEVRLTPTIAAHDVEYKSKNIEKFLLEGKKVQLMMKFTPRELHHKDIGYNTINFIVEKFQEFAVIEVPPRFNGKMLLCILSPKRK
jgi:translation initiation factor IF-3